MPNYIIKEERISEFVGSLFKLIGKRKGKSLAKKMNLDKKLQGYIKQAEKTAYDIETHIKQRRKDDPEYAAAADSFDDFLKS